MSPKARTFWPLLLITVLTDCTTKDLAVDHLSSIPHSVVDSFLRFTLVYNPGTAFGFDLRPYIGEWARPVLICVMVAVLGVLLRLYWRTGPRARLVGAGLGLACAGAIGNILDRLRFPRGVVDFIDVGVAGHRFWIFNVADAAITVGAILLAVMVWRDEGMSPRPAEPSA